MSVDAVSLSEITRTLSEMQAPSSSNTVSASQAAAFATTLSEAEGALSMALGGNTGTFTNTLSGLGTLGSSQFSGGANTSTPSLTSAESELNLIAMLLQSQSGASSPASGAMSANAVGVSGVGAVATDTATATASQVIQRATSLEGTPYVWGGTSPSGFDCSGLVQYVYGQSGISLPRTSQEQANVGTPVAGLANAQPGDLLFFAGSDGTAASPGHVGIYVGNGQMIDAPYTGTVVQEQSVGSAGNIVAIRRVIPEPTAVNTVMGNVTVPAPYVSMIENAAAAHGIPAPLLAALVARESGFNPNAVSSAGAEGIAQFMPSTASGMGVNPLDPSSAIDGAARLLSAYATRFGSYADALAAYNAGPTAVARYGGVPPYPETQAYVPSVLALAGLGSSMAVPA